MRRRSSLALVACLCMVLPALATGFVDGTAARPDDPNPCVGTMTEPANGITVVSVQGMRVGDDGGKRPARLIAFGPRGEIEWVHERDDAIWFYDVDPQDDGTLFLSATVEDRDGDDQAETAFFVLDPETGEVVWEEIVGFHDTHDADLLDDERILVGNMRATEDVDGNRDRVLVYNRTTEEVEWDWQFRDHFDDESIGGNYSDDWTHLNDVDAVNETHYLASPRNFDMVVMIDRTTGELEWTLGEPGEFDVMKKQHNPAYYESENGTPTVLVADSGNDRVVEYARHDGEWERTWSVGNESTMSWPRDADRLPNGNTLVADSTNDRVFEVTPDGEVVWEVSTPWLTYEVERVEYGDEPAGPTIADQNATGDVSLHGDERPNSTEQEPCAAAIRNATRFSELGAEDDGVGDDIGDAVDDFVGGDDGDGEGDAGTSDAVSDVVRNDDGGIDPIRALALALAGAFLVVTVGGLAIGYRRLKGDE